MMRNDKREKTIEYLNKGRFKKAWEVTAPAEIYQ